jgi:hypothetical protein
VAGGIMIIKVMCMKLLKARLWNWTDIAFLKWSALLFGMIVGAYFSDFVKQYAIALLLIACLLAIRPLIAYFKDSK